MKQHFIVKKEPPIHTLFGKMIWNKKNPSASIFSLFVYSQIGKTLMFMVTLST